METPGEKNDAKAASFYGTKPVFAGQKSNSNRTSCKDRIMSLFSSIGNKSGKGRKIEADRIKIVLLLMDLASRRFELLQLEFDSLRKCTVSHVLSQIALCATTASLRLQKYSCIAGNDGVEMPSSSILESFCRGNELLVAIPEGLTAEECILHARPILLDKKVRNMVCRKSLFISFELVDLHPICLTLFKFAIDEWPTTACLQWCRRHGVGDRSGE